MAIQHIPIEQLLIRKCHIEQLYGNIFYKTQVRVLKIYDTPIKTINEHTFYGINITLQELHLVNTELNEFPRLAFKVLGNLTVLNIDHHTIMKLDKNILSESLMIGKLEKLHFTNGNLTDLLVESFQVNYSLYIKLSSTKLS